MIHSLDIKHPANTPLKWLGQVESLKAPRNFTFTPGLNILWGRNGSGKSTVLKLMARVLHCEQGGGPLISETSLSDLCARINMYRGKEGLTKDLILGSMVLRHDGQGVRLFDPGKAVGLTGGSFDYDFGMAGIQNTMFKGSAGQTTMFRFEEILSQCVDGKPAPEIRSKISRDRVNDLWQDRFDLAEAFLKGNAEKGPATVMLDEPERSFDLPLQAQCWRFIRAAARTHQIIVASHSVFALNIPEANYIQMEPEYLAASQRAVGLLPTWADEKPEMPRKAAIAKDPGTKPSKKPKAAQRAAKRRRTPMVKR